MGYNYNIFPANEVFILIWYACVHSILSPFEYDTFGSYSVQQKPKHPFVETTMY